MDWERHSGDWPHREHSRFVRAAGMLWHVQTLACADASRAADAPVALLIHGTCASTHSWRAVMPLLATRFDVVAVDLPGHGFTGMPAAGALSRHFGLPGMAAALGELLRALPTALPALIVGHSAGAAVAMRMALAGHAAPRAVVSLNGAFQPLAGVAGQVLPPVAKLAAVLPGLPRLFAWRAGDRAVLRQLIDSTGSTLDAEGTALYARLAGDAAHVGGALAMMANWDLRPLLKDLPTLGQPLALMAGSADKTIAPAQAAWAHAQLPSSTLITFNGLGHLAHEEAPGRVADAIVQFWTASITTESPPLPARTGPS